MNLEELKDKVVKNISEYLEFDVNEIFELSNYIAIYGGAVRDSIAEMEINDVDILCMPNSAIDLSKYINEKDYKKVELYDQDTLNMYKGIRIISEPLTFLNKNRKVIQIIKPSFRSTIEDYNKAYIDLIKNVDISCCGVFLEHNGKELVLKESCKNAIVSCMSKVYEVNKWSRLYNRERTDFRCHKLDKRGWFNLNNDHFTDNLALKKVNRRLKISQLNFTPEVKDKYYKVWFDHEYDDRKTYRERSYDYDDNLPF
jgi:hypothetical protein